MPGPGSQGTFGDDDADGALASPPTRRGPLCLAPPLEKKTHTRPAHTRGSPHTRKYVRTCTRPHTHAGSRARSLECRLPGTRSWMRACCSPSAAAGCGRGVGGVCFSRFWKRWGWFCRDQAQTRTIPLHPHIKTRGAHTFAPHETAHALACTHTRALSRAHAQHELVGRGCMGHASGPGFSSRPMCNSALLH